MRGQEIAIDNKDGGGHSQSSFASGQGCARPEKWNPNVTEKLTTDSLSSPLPFK